MRPLAGRLYGSFQVPVNRVPRFSPYSSHLARSAQAAAHFAHSLEFAIQAEHYEQGQAYQDLYEAVGDLKRRHDLHSCAVRPRDGLALRRDSEREVVQDLVKRFRCLPPPDQQRRLLGTLFATLDPWTFANGPENEPFLAKVQGSRVPRRSRGHFLFLFHPFGEGSADSPRFVDDLIEAFVPQHLLGQPLAAEVKVLPATREAIPGLAEVGEVLPWHKS